MTERYWHNASSGGLIRSDAAPNDRWHKISRAEYLTILRGIPSWSARTWDATKLYPYTFRIKGKTVLIEAASRAEAEVKAQNDFGR